jgi:ribose 5-phosphate isomerase A
MNVHADPKREVGRHAAAMVTDGMTLGLGTGSTADHFLDALGERVRAGLRVRGVPTSERTARRAEENGIGLVTLEECPILDLAVDGADQVDPHGDLIKGLGGALLREKKVARAAREFVVIVDATKRVEILGDGCPVPVEVDPARCDAVDRALRELGARPVRRVDAAGATYVTDNGGWILDAHFGPITGAADLEQGINDLPGVRDNGLFVGLVNLVLTAGPDGIEKWAPSVAKRNSGTPNQERC